MAVLAHPAEDLAELALSEPFTNLAWQPLARDRLELSDLLLICSVFLVTFLVIIVIIIAVEVNVNVDINTTTTTAAVLSFQLADPLAIASVMALDLRLPLSLPERRLRLISSRLYLVSY